jgi:hypothetical protein
LNCFILFDDLQFHWSIFDIMDEPLHLVPATA